MTKEEKEAVLHCLRWMIDEELCEECPLYGMTGSDHCEKDCVRLAIEELEQKPKTDVLDKIRAEIDEEYDRVHPYDISCAEGLEMALNIIDKFKAESEEKE